MQSSLIIQLELPATEQDLRRRALPENTSKLIVRSVGGDAATADLLMSWKQSNELLIAYPILSFQPREGLVNYLATNSITATPAADFLARTNCINAAQLLSVIRLQNLEMLLCYYCESANEAEQVERHLINANFDTSRPESVFLEALKVARAKQIGVFFAPSHGSLEVLGENRLVVHRCLKVAVGL